MSMKKEKPLILLSIDDGVNAVSYTHLTLPTRSDV